VAARRLYSHRRFAQKSSDFPSAAATLALVDRSYSEWVSFSQLIQELISGAIRRHVFSQWELDLLLDLQHSQLHRSARKEMLRRYSRLVQQQYADGALIPPRLSVFLRERSTRLAASRLRLAS